MMNEGLLEGDVEIHGHSALAQPCRSAGAHGIAVLAAIAAPNPDRIAKSVAGGLDHKVLGAFQHRDRFVARLQRSADIALCTGSEACLAAGLVNGLERVDRLVFMQVETVELRGAGGLCQTREKIGRASCRERVLMPV